MSDFPLLPFSINEIPGSRTSSRGQNPADSFHFTITGPRDEATARALRDGMVPVTWGPAPLWLQAVEVVERKSTFGIWDGSANYGPVKLPDAGDWTWDFDCTPETIHVTHGVRHIRDYGSPSFPGAAPNHQGAIGVTADGSIEGCDWYGPKFEWNEKHVLQYTGAADAWQLATNLANFAGCLNSGNFRGFGPGCVLFVGASGGRSTTRPGLFDLTVRFRAQGDATGLVIGDITGIAKKAWEYLWVESKPKKDPASPNLIQMPAAVHIEQMGTLVDFSGLGINMGPPTY